MNWINALIKSLYAMMPRQKTNIQITSSEARNIINSQLNVREVCLEDRTYRLVNLDYIKKFAANSYVPTMKYIPEVFDCDNSARTFYAGISMMQQGHAFGVATVDRKPNATGGMHKLNILICEDQRVYMLEPQNGDIYEIPEEWKVHSITF